MEKFSTRSYYRKGATTRRRTWTVTVLLVVRRRSEIRGWPIPASIQVAAGDILS